MPSLASRVLADLGQHPKSKAPAIARRLGATRPQVSSVLQTLREAGQVTVHGARSFATWSRAETETTSPPPPPSVAPVSITDPPSIPGVTSDGGVGHETPTSELALVDELLDLMDVPRVSDRRVRLGMLAGRVLVQRSTAS